MCSVGDGQKFWNYKGELCEKYGILSYMFEWLKNDNLKG